MVNLPDFDQLWDYSNPAATEQAFRELLPQAKASGDISYYAQLLSQIARTQGLQGNYADAHAMLDRAEQLSGPELKEALIRIMLERGRVFNSSGEKEKAEPLFIHAWHFGRTHNLDYYAVDAAHMMGFLLAGTGKPKEKLEWEEKALAYAENSESEKAKKWLGSLYNNIGWSYHEMTAFQKAKDLFKKCLAWQEANDRVNGAKIARWSIAKMDRLLGNPETALKVLLDLLKAEGDDDPSGYTFEELAECYVLLGDKRLTIFYAQKAWEQLSKDSWLASNEPSRLERLKMLSSA